MNCPNCGKELPDNAAKCKKCGTVFKENKGNAEMDAYLKKEKEKAAKKNQKLEKKSGKRSVNKGLIIGIAAGVAVVAAALILLFHFGIIGSRNFHRVEEKGPLDVEYTFEIGEDDEVIMKFGDVEITEDEYEFFYRQSYSTLQNSSQLSFKEFVSKKLGEEFDENDDYYDEYYSSFAQENPNTFDFKRPIDRQITMSVDSETGKETSWSEYIRNDAVKSMLEYRVKFELANEMKLELTDDVRLQVYDHIEGLRSAVREGGYPSLDEYLKILFGEACDEEFFKNELIREYMATKYETQINAKLMAEYSDSDIKAIYDADYKEYDFVDLYVYEAKGDDASAVAQKIAAKATGLAEFTDAISEYVGKGADKEAFPAVPKYYIDSNYTEEVGEWAFDRQRKQGDVSVFKTQNGYTVAYVYAPAYTKEDCVSYREIVFNKTDANGKYLEGEALEAVKAKAEEILEQWDDGDATEDTFAYFAMSESQGSTAGSGGLNAGVVSMTMNEDALKEWLLSDERKPGDVEIVETDDAFRIVYFTNGYGDYWNYSIRSTKASEAAAQKLETAKSKTYAVSYDAEVMRDVEQSYIDNISEIYLGIESK
ncbi:MAG: zinc-ribbon domain-containing protein [Clostridia bacterium]|nr:zinc-ribbon domain-containing protein [Clostridia bacterium]